METCVRLYRVDFYFMFEPSPESDMKYIEKWKYHGVVFLLAWFISVGFYFGIVIVVLHTTHGTNSFDENIFFFWKIHLISIIIIIISVETRILHFDYRSAQAKRTLAVL